MKYFKQLDYPVIPGLLDSLNIMLDNGTVDFGPGNDQICLNTTPDRPHDFTYGKGSLIYDWDNKVIDDNGNVTVPKRETPLSDADFTQLCTQFVGTPYETLYNYLNERYVLGRLRLMKIHPKRCLTWHIDDSIRIHYPLDTNDQCRMVIEDEVMYMPANTWWETDTTHFHTAFNGSKNNRIHVVAVILDNK